MLSFKRSLLVGLLTNGMAVSLLAAVIISCKKDDTGTTPSTTSIQGNWRLTSLNINPAYMSFTELVNPLSLLEGNCIAGTTLMFNSNGTVTNNASSISACTTAANSKLLISTFFGASTTYTETDNQLTVRGPQTVTASKTIAGGTATLVTSLSVNPANQPTPTSYTLVMTKL